MKIIITDENSVSNTPSPLFKGLSKEEKKERFLEIHRQVAGLSCVDISRLIHELQDKQKEAIISPYLLNPSMKQQGEILSQVQGRDKSGR